MIRKCFNLKILKIFLKLIVYLNALLGMGVAFYCDLSWDLTLSELFKTWISNLNDFTNIIINTIQLYFKHTDLPINTDLDFKLKDLDN